MEELRTQWGRVVLAARGGDLLARIRRLMVSSEHERLPPWWQSPVATLIVIAGLVAGLWGMARSTADSHAPPGAKSRDDGSGAIGQRDEPVAADTAGVARQPELSGKRHGERPAGDEQDDGAPVEYLPRPTKAERKIIAALDQPTSVEFNDTPLETCLEYLKDYHQISLRVDRAALADRKMRLDQPITLKVAGLSLRGILKLLLEPVRMTYVIHHDMMRITTVEKSEQILMTRTYPVNDLYQEQTPAGDPPLDEAGSQKGTRAMSRPGDLERAITKAIAPDSWDDKQGPGSITYVAKSGSLVIRHNAAVHAQVLQLLRDLREAKRAGQGASQKAPSRTGWKLRGPKLVETYSLVGIMDLNGDGEDDRGLLRRLVAAIGGSIDNDVDELGVIRIDGTFPDDGKASLSDKTKFIVVGRIPDVADLSDPHEIATTLKIAGHYKDLQDQARARGVRIITLKDFLRYIGYEARATDGSRDESADVTADKLRPAREDDVIGDQPASPEKTDTPPGGLSANSVINSIGRAKQALLKAQQHADSTGCAGRTPPISTKSR
jgi:hypothetical protein